MEHLRTWYIKNEELVFRARVANLLHQDQERLFSQNGVAAKLLTSKELEGDPKLKAITESMKSRNSGKGAAAGKGQQAQVGQAGAATTTGWYKVPFTHAVEAVRRRDVACYKGYALLQHSDVITILVGMFRSRLVKGLGEAALARLRLLESESRDVVDMLDAIVSVDALNSTPKEESTMGVVRPHEIDDLARKHFPPCMSQLHDQLKRDQHLKFHGRWQYGTFLKRIGLSMEDAVTFFGENEKGGLEAFKRSSYAYSIRHYYGKEGKHTNYSAMGCTAIIMGAPPSSGSCHGCPFRHSDEATILRTVSNTTSANTADIEDLGKSVRGGHYTKACHQYFRMVHPTYRGDQLFATPYQYFEASVGLVKPLPGVISDKKRSRLDAPEMTKREDA
jgi:DNA primase large subunit